MKDGVNGTNYPQYAVRLTNSTGFVIFQLGVSTGATTQQSVTTTVAPALNTWSHIACVRSGTMLYIFINGTSAVTPTAQTITPVSSGKQLMINNQISGASNHGVNAYLSDLRITKGVARYTSNFTPRPLPFETK